MPYKNLDSVLDAILGGSGGGGGRPNGGTRYSNLDAVLSASLADIGRPAAERKRKNRLESIVATVNNDGSGGGGGGGFSFGGLFGKVGQVLSYPLHAVTSAEKELADALTHPWTHDKNLKHKDASLNDFWQQIVDPERQINFGQVLGKGNEASGVHGFDIGGKVKLPHVRIPLPGDRSFETPRSVGSAAALGFALDLVNDPLTYLGGVGLAKSGGKKLAEEVAQSGSRLLAKEAAEKSAFGSSELASQLLNDSEGIGKLVERFKATPEGMKLLEETGTATSAARRGGVSKLSEEQIQKFLTREGTSKPLAQRGLGFGIGENNLKIPFTDRGPLAALGEGYHSALAKLGDLHYGSATGKAFESARDLKIAARSTDAKTALEATLAGLARSTSHREGEFLANAANHQLDAALKPLSKEERALVPKAVQGDAAALASLGGKHEPVAALLDDLGTQAQEVGLNINKVEDYFPRRIDPKAKKLLTEAGLISKKGQFNGPSGFASEVARKLKPGENTFMGEKFVAKTEAEIVDKAGIIALKKLGDIDPALVEKFGGFFHNDPEAVLRGYIQGWSKRVAQAKAAKHLYEQGIGKSLAREVVAAPGSKKAASKISQKLEAALAAVGATEGKLARAEGKSETTQQKLERELAGLADEGPAPAAAPAGLDAAATVPSPQTAVSPTDAGPSVSYTNAKADLADALMPAPGGGVTDVMGAREAFAEIVRQSGVSSPSELARIVDDHFIEEAGGMIADSKAIMRYVRNAEEERIAKLTDPAKLRFSDDAPQTGVKAPQARREAAAVSVAQTGPDTVRMAQEAPESILADVSHLTEQEEHLSALLGSAAPIPPGAREHLEEMHEAVKQGVQWGKAQASDIAQADKRIGQIAAYERTAAKARIKLADLHQKVIGYEEKLAHVSDQTTEQIVGRMKDAAGQELTMLRRDIGTPDYIAKWLADSEQLITPEAIRNGLKHYDSVVGWIKDYQIAYPGFHIRNAMGGVFNNALAGMHTSSYGRLLGMWKRAAGGKLRESELKLWDDVQRSVGSGQIGEESLFGRGGAAAFKGKGKLNPFSRNNLLTKGSRWTGEQVEFLLRGSLALDTLKRGGTIDDAVQMVSKFHFDYGDLSKFEQGLRHVVPFYTWTRKNLPLQIEQLTKNPKWANRYFMAKTETEQLSGPDSIVPGYFGDLGAIRTPMERGGGHVYATPDLPLRDLAKFGGGGSNPFDDVLSMVTPVLKTPIEMKFGKQSFNNLPLRDDKFVPVPLPAILVKGLSPALKGLGVLEEKNGKYFVTEKNAYALEQAIPFIGRARRLFPKEDKYETRRMTTWLSLFGVGTRTNTTQEQEGARMSQTFSQSAERRRQKALEKAAGG